MDTVIFIQIIKFENYHHFCCPTFIQLLSCFLVVPWLFKDYQDVYINRTLRPISSMLISWDGDQSSLCVLPAALTFHSSGLHHIHPCVQSSYR